MKEVFNMKVVKVKDYEELCRWAADQVIQRVRTTKEFHLGLATGSTPEGVYQNLINDHQQQGTSYRHIYTYNLDEYAGMQLTDPNSYHYYMNHRLFRHIDIPLEQTNIPNGIANDLAVECVRYESLIEEVKGVDLQLLGIGNNGHIGFNEPGTAFDTKTHLVELTPSTREANQRFFSSLNQVPTHAITMGIATILKSKKILLLASGEHKAGIIKQLITGAATEDLPASALKMHQDVTIVADEDALSHFDEDEVFEEPDERK